MGGFTTKWLGIMERAIGRKLPGTTPLAAEVTYRAGTPKRLSMSRRTPYKCPSCGGNAVIAPRSGMSALCLYLAALAIPLFALDYLGVPRVTLFAACVAAVVSIPIVFARICRFDPRTSDSQIMTPNYALERTVTRQWLARRAH